MIVENMTEDEKREWIISRIDCNMFVEAGAGAGKTTIIVSRIVRQLMSGIRPEEIAVITFTNAATRELRSRIFAKTEAEAHSPSSQISPEERENLEQALRRLDRMQISTIHSFCYRILSEKMFEAGLPCGFELLEEDDIRSRRDRLFALWAEKLSAEEWKLLLKAGGYRRRVLERIRCILDQIADIPEDNEICSPKQFLDDAGVRAELDPILSDIENGIVRLVRAAYGGSYQSLGDIDDRYLVKHGKELKAVLAEGNITLILQVLGREEKILNERSVTYAVIESLGYSKKEEQIAYKKRVQDQHAELLQKIGGYREKLQSILLRYRNTLFEPYIRYAGKAKEYIRQNLGSDVITNNQLLEKTKELLNQSPEAARYVGEKFRYLYVDEFQDTDHVQEEFIRRIASDPESPGQLRNGALFVVGDPKQSIYRFRGAEPEVYFKTREYMAGLDNACVVELTNNYRTNDRIIEWVNAVFRDKNITEGRSYVPMRAVHTLPKTLPAQVLAGVFCYQSPEEALDRKEISTDQIAVCRLIRALTEQEHFIMDKGVERRIRYSDFLVLSMTTTGMSEYEDAFHRYGIPVITDSKRNILGERELNAYLRLYAYLADPYDVIAKEGAMETLSATGMGQRDGNHGILYRIAEDTKEMSSYGCAQYLLQRPELYLDKDTELLEHWITGYQQKLIQMTEKAAASGFGNRRQFLADMQEYMQKEVGHELQLSEAPNAIRFMNLHKAKGLEGNIVIWTNRLENWGSGGRGYRNGTKYYPMTGFSTSYGFHPEWTAYDEDQELMARSAEEADCENVRLQYVAATRAAQVLIFMDRYNGKAGNMFSEGFSLTDLPSISGMIGEYKEPEDSRSAKPLIFEHKKKPEMLEKQKMPVYLPESPSGYEDENAGKEGLIAGENAAKNAIGRLRRPTGNIFGLVMHRAFELLVRRICVGYEDMGVAPQQIVPVCIEQAIRERSSEISQADGKNYRAYLTEMLNVFGQWLIREQWPKKGEKFYTELPFSYRIEAKRTGEPPVWMHGEADLVIRLKDGNYYLFDYKSDTDERYRDEEAMIQRLKGKYAPQISAYRAALSRVFDIEEERIKAALLSFSQKNLPKGHKLRLRVTEV